MLLFALLRLFVYTRDVDVDVDLDVLGDSRLPSRMFVAMIDGSGRGEFLLYLPTEEARRFTGNECHLLLRDTLARSYEY